MTALNRITEHTTLAEIGLACACYGVHTWDVKHTPDDKNAIVVVLKTERYTAIGQGATLHAAFDDAFARILHRTGAEVCEARP